MGAAALAAPAATHSPAPAREPAGGGTPARKVAPANPLWQSLAMGAGASAPLQRKCAACGDEREEEAGSFTVQAKCAIGPADDAYEREADSVSARVMSAPAVSVDRPAALSAVTTLPVLRRKPLDVPQVQRECLACEEEGEEAPESSHDLHSLVSAPGPGAPLSQSMRGRIEPVLGANLSGVRVHSNSRSQTAAAAIDAKAFTHGGDIFLGAGQSGDDVALMAHEATHVAQQGAALPLDTEVEEEDLEQEEEVDSPADEAVDGGAAGEGAPDGQADSMAPGAQRAPGADAAGGLADGRPRATAAEPAGGRAPSSDTRRREADQQRAHIDAVPTVGAEPRAGDARLVPGAATPVKDGAPAAANGDAEAAPLDGAAQDPAADGGASAPSSDTQAGLAGDSPDETAPADQSVARIESAPESRLKPFAVAEMNNITSDSDSTEDAIAGVLGSASASVSERFEGVRSGIREFVEENIASVTTFVIERQIRVMSLTMSVFTGAQTFVSTTIDGAKATVTGLKEKVDGIVTSAIESVEDTISGITEDINDTINDVSLPDLPGVETVREFITGMISSAGSAVNSALGAAKRLIRSVVAAAARLANALLELVRTALSALIRALSQVVTSLLQALFNAFNSVLRAIGSGLRSAIYGLIFPMLRSMERLIIQQLARVAAHLVSQVRANRDAHLQALADSLSGGCTEIAGGEATTTSEEEWVESIRELSREAAAINRLIIEVFLVRIPRIFVMLITTLQTAVAMLIARISAMVSQLIDWITGIAATIIGAIVDAFTSAIEFVTGVLRSFFDAVTDLIQWVRDFVQSPIDAVVDFARTMLRRLLSAVASAVANVVRQILPGGGSVPLVLPLFIPGESLLAPSPVIPLRGPWPKPKPPPVEEPDVITIIIVVVVAVVAVLVVVAVVVLLLILLWLLIKWIVRRLRKKKKTPCRIFTQTLVPAPDGTADDRTTVGVNEDVKMWAMFPVSWSATAGTLTPDGTGGVIWTAPILGGPCIVTATPADPDCPACFVTMAVTPPSERAQGQPPSPRAYDDDKAGSGFVAITTIKPMNVSFAKVETQEQSVNAVATGYYDTELSWNGIAHPLGSWLPIDSGNNGLNDTIGTDPPGTGGNFGVGSFLWAIPQHYRPAGGGSGIYYSTGNHTQDMTGTDATETTAKEGASRTRRPPKVVRENPMKTDTARTIPTLAPNLDNTSYGTGTVTLLNGASEIVGTNMLTEYLTKDKGGGGPPSGQDSIYGFRVLPTKRAHNDSTGNATGYRQTQVYIRGHLLNDNLGGVGEPRNLYPITGQANADHLNRVENVVKGLVRLPGDPDGLVVRYHVTAAATSSPQWMDVQGDGTCMYQYMDAAFSCTYSTYKLFNDGTVEENAQTTVPIGSNFDEPGFITNVATKGCYEKSH